ncbi:MAG: uroporphyrinogen-III C-methyltransferase [Luteimonas sp.]
MDPPPTTIRKQAWLPWLLAIALLALLGWRGWNYWQTWQIRSAAIASAQSGQWDAMQARVDAIRRDQRALSQRIAGADATNRILRDEVIGIGQRAALLEDNVAKLAKSSRPGSQALRLEDVELLLSSGAQRLLVAGDLAGARRAYALAAGVLDGIDDPGYLDLRQALAEERGALDRMGLDPKVAALERLDALDAMLQLPGALPARVIDLRRPWWQRAFARLVQVHPADRRVSVAPGDREAGFAALQLELTLARAAAERRDEAGWKAALIRADAWLERLSPASPALQATRSQLSALRALPLVVRVPAFGSTLRQLQAIRSGP